LKYNESFPYVLAQRDGSSCNFSDVHGDLFSQIFSSLMRVKSNPRIIFDMVLDDTNDCLSSNPEGKLEDLVKNQIVL
jgi:hypothetical protein